ncbi:isoaspartyl peptidase/L-asparaginase [Myxococcota bacterium]|nr:isoaspartyl peptidase/L-asparaginase [Myxococcota bacterium]
MTTGRVVMVHGGAGAMARILEDGGAAYRAGMADAVRAGWGSFAAGGAVLDAAVEAVVAMEASGGFNAGLGSALNRDGDVEMDAAVMRGADRLVGAVGAVRRVASPVRLAREVAEGTPHCLLVGEGALAFARERGLPLRRGFPSAAQRAEWRRRLASRDSEGVSGLAAAGSGIGPGQDPGRDTVGAVACDGRGGVAAAVSTGGLWLKLPGRVGDSPLPGAGYWAEDGVGAAVATGTGETILRVLMCRAIVDAMARGAHPGEACRVGVALVEERFGTDTAGAIAVDARGRTGHAFNTGGMGRAVMGEGRGDPVVGVLPGEP